VRLRQDPRFNARRCFVPGADKEWGTGSVIPVDYGEYTRLHWLPREAGTRLSNPPDHEATELVIAVVAAVGTEIDLVMDQIATYLDDFGYETHSLRLSDYLAEHSERDFLEKPFDEKVWEAMTAGDELRQAWDRSDALALHAISDIVATRDEAAENAEDSESETKDSENSEEELSPNLSRHAFLIRSLKTPDELETLRSVYGPRLVVIAAYSPREKRLKHVADQIEDSRNTVSRDTWAHQPEALIDRDEKEQESRGQDVSGTFHRADFFIRGWNREVIGEDLKRTLEILFGDPFHTPTRDEYCQFMASGAAFRSSELGRQVGAAIATDAGSVIALGSNEVPKPHGGSPWEGDGTKYREFEIGDIDTNRKHFDALAKELSATVDERLNSVIEGISGEAADRQRLDAVREAVVASLPNDLRKAGLNELTEFGRAVHAEMNAILDAARRGIAVQGATLYTTTFPCHNCARHVIGAGVERVVFIEPYIKSRTAELHSDAVRIDDDPGGENDDRIVFEAFVGVAPRRYREVFDAAAKERLGHCGRQDESGHKQEFDKKAAVPVFPDAGLAQFRPEWREYRMKELLALEHFDKHMKEEQGS
jgi:cytidine deaminase